VKTARLFIAFIFLLAPALAALAQESPAPDEPAWVEYEKGELALSQKDYGQAVLHFKNALAITRVMPEAEVGLGDVYFYQGDYAIAEQQYLRAYDQRPSFAVPDRQYETLYRLARLYQFQKQYGKMEERLKLIIQDDAIYSGQSQEQKRYRNSLFKLFTNKGFDAMFLLNRMSESFSTNALSDLAYNSYTHWNFEPALQYALFGIIPLVTEGMLTIRDTNIDYRYTTLDDFLREALANDDVRPYLADRDFFRRLYYLALICYENITVRDWSRSFMKLLANTDAAGEYQRLARLQLKKPWRENRSDAPKIEMP
jgi:tetratricopeptide (TPR) repeat protein